MKPIQFSSAFQQIFFTVLCFTLLSGSGSIWLAGQGKLSPEQTRVFETLNTTWNMGIVAILGLLGSKATDLLNEDENRDDQK